MITNEEIVNVLKRSIKVYDTRGFTRGVALRYADDESVRLTVVEGVQEKEISKCCAGGAIFLAVNQEMRERNPNRYPDLIYSGSGFPEILELEKEVFFCVESYMLETGEVDHDCSLTAWNDSLAISYGLTPVQKIRRLFKGVIAWIEGGHNE